MRKLSLFFVPLLVLTGILYSHRECISQTYSVEIIDGVRVVHNKASLWGANPTIELQFIRQIGDFNAKDDNYLFFGPAGVSVDSKGDIYILDQGNYRIQKYDADGNFVKTIGRQGQGPSEFILPGAIYIDKDDNLYVNDAGDMNGKILVLNTDGKEIRRLRIDVIAPKLTTFGILSSDEIIAQSSSNDISLLSLYSLDGIEVNFIGNSMIFKEEIFNKIVKRDLQFTIDYNDNAYISYGYLNRIEKYTPEGKLIFQSDRPIDFDTTLRIVTNKNPVSNISYKNAKGNKISQSIAVDGKKRIFVVTYRRQEKDDEKANVAFYYSYNVSISVNCHTDKVETDLFGLDIFDNNGILLAQIPIKHFCDILRIYGDRLFIIDRLHGMCVYEYKIVEK